MTGKDQVIDFINYLFILILIIFAMMFFIVPGRFEAFTALMKSLMPLSFFGIALLIKLKLARHEIKVKRQDNQDMITLCLTYFDKAKTELLVYLLPIIICLIPLLIGESLTIVDVSQAIIAFILVYLLQKNLFSKRA